VYYKLPEADLPALLPRVRALQAALGAAVPVRTGLQARVDAPDGVATVMETYAGISDAERFGQALTAALAASDLPPPLRAGRRTERFRDL